MSKKIINTVLGICLFSWMHMGIIASPAEGDSFEDFGVIHPKKRLPAPSFSLKDLKGNAVSLEDYKGKIVVMVFWATWCDPCREEMPTLKKLYKLYQDKGLAVLGISIDRSNGKRVKSFVEEAGLTYPILMDEDQSVRKKYQVEALPTSHLIGRDGKCLGFISGQRDWGSEEALKLISELLQD